MKALVVSLLVVTTALGVEITEWRNVQTLDVPQPGLRKVSLPPATLHAARAGLEDLRILDATGREVPYALERSARRLPALRNPKNFTVTITGRKTILLLETGCPEPVEAVTLLTPARDFIKAVTVEGSADQQTWQPLAAGQPIFRQATGAGNLRVAIPEGQWAFLRVTVDDGRAEAVPFTGAQLHALTGENARVEAVPVVISDRSENNTQTRLTLDLGAAHLRLASLQIATSEPLFARAVSVAVRQMQENAVTEQVLARDTIYQVAVEGQVPAARLELALDVPVLTREVLLLIENADNAPLPVSAVRATVWPVEVVFHAAQAGAYRILTGNSRCEAPHYDMGTLRQSLALGAVPLVTPATVSPVAPNPSYRPGEALPDLQDLGTPFDTTAWWYRKPVQVTRAGVQQLDLDLDVLARADHGFRDLRLVRDGKQRPYVLERTTIARKLVPEIITVNDPKRPAISRWQIKLPQANLPVTRVTCATTTPLFRRQVALNEQPLDERGEKYTRHLGFATWVRTPPVTRALLELTLTQAPVTDTLVVETDNGDNPPVQLANWQVFYPVTRVLFKAPLDAAGWLYFGNREASFPRYDLDLLASQMLAEEKTPATLGGLETLKKAGRSGAGQSTRTGNAIFFGVLAIVVIGLFAVIAKLVPKNPPPAPH